MEVRYILCTAISLGELYRVGGDPDFATYSFSEKKWVYVEDDEEAEDVFFNNRMCRNISEEEAMKFIKDHQGPDGWKD